MGMGSPPLELFVGILNVDRKGFGEAKAKLLKQVFVRGRSCVGVTGDRRRLMFGSVSI